MIEDKLYGFITKESMLMKILNNVSYEYEPHMDKKSYQNVRSSVKHFIFEHGYNLPCDAFSEFKSYCESQFDEYFKDDMRIQ